MQVSEYDSPEEQAPFKDRLHSLHREPNLPGKTYILLGLIMVTCQNQRRWHYARHWLRTITRLTTATAVLLAHDRRNKGGESDSTQCVHFSANLITTSRVSLTCQGSLARRQRCPRRRLLLIDRDEPSRSRSSHDCFDLHQKSGGRPWRASPRSQASHRGRPTWGSLQPEVRQPTAWSACGKTIVLHVANLPWAPICSAANSDGNRIAVGVFAFANREDLRVRAAAAK